MDNGKYQVLYEKFPKIFNVTANNPKMPFPMFGFECGDGWFHIIQTLCYQIQTHIDWHNSQRERLLQDNPYNIEIPKEISQVVVDQVKEKYGTLRFYYHGGDERIDGMVRMTEAMSETTCEICGNLGHLRGGGWVYTACDQHTRPEDLIDK